MKRPAIIIRGGGELASGVAHRLYVCGFRPVILELAEPRMIRRTVCFAEAVYSRVWTIEGVIARLAREGIPKRFEGFIPVIVDPEGALIRETKPHIVVDARMLKQPEDISREHAPLVIGLGPGIKAGKDAHAVIETQRGPMLGRVYRDGTAIPDTGIPGNIGGKTKERLLIAGCDGHFENLVMIGERVTQGQPVARISGGYEVRAAFEGTVRGLLKGGLLVKTGEKVGDIDPRPDVSVSEIGDKSRAIGGGVLEAIFSTIPWSMEDSR